MEMNVFKGTVAKSAFLILLNILSSRNLHAPWNSMDSSVKSDDWSSHLSSHLYVNRNVLATINFSATKKKKIKCWRTWNCYLPKKPRPGLETIYECYQSSEYWRHKPKSKACLKSIAGCSRTSRNRTRMFICLLACLFYSAGDHFRVSSGRAG